MELWDLVTTHDELFRRLQEFVSWVWRALCACLAFTLALKAYMEASGTPSLKVIWVRTVDWLQQKQNTPKHDSEAAAEPSRVTKSGSLYPAADNLVGSKLSVSLCRYNVFYSTHLFIRIYTCMPTYMYIYVYIYIHMCVCIEKRYK